MLEAHSDVGGDILDRPEPGCSGPVKANVTSTSRKFCLAILLSLLVGHAALIAHEATHIADEAVECELCISHGAPAALPPAGPDHEFLNLPQARVAVDTGTVFAPRYFTPCGQRGPPV